MFERFFERFRPVGPRVVAQPVVAQPVDGPIARSRLRNAYRQGRVDEDVNHRHARSPFLMALMALVALMGAGFIALAIHEGSFSAAGALIDGKLASVGQQTAQVRNATGDAVVRAGDSLKAQGDKLKAGSSPDQAGQNQTGQNQTGNPS